MYDAWYRFEEISPSIDLMYTTKIFTWSSSGTLNAHSLYQITLIIHIPVFGPFQIRSYLVCKCFQQKIFHVKPCGVLVVICKVKDHKSFPTFNFILFARVHFQFPDNFCLFYFETVVDKEVSSAKIQFNLICDNIHKSHRK